MKRLIALVLAMVMVFAVMSEAVAATLTPATTDDMHFIILHWHAVDVNGDYSLNANRGDYYTTVEGTISPEPGGTYTYSLISGDAYFRSFNSRTGEITLNIMPRRDQSENAKPEDPDYELLADVSVSAGHIAVTDGPGNPGAQSITVQYRPETHLVKAHVFYRLNEEYVKGTVDKTRLGVTGGQEVDPQKDTYGSGSDKVY